MVIVTPDGLEWIDRTLAHLRSQTAREEIELVAVGPKVGAGESDGGELDGFGAVSFVEHGPILSLGAALAAGIRAASSPVVVCAEEHSYPEPGWAQALVAALEEPWVAVGGVLENANPASMVSWSQLYTDFGSAVAPAPPGEATELAAHHTAYRREALLEYGQRLDRMMEVEWVLQEDLRRSGRRLRLEPRAVSRHLNPSRIGSALRSELFGGRSFAATRAETRKWSPARRAAYILASPLVFALRMVRGVRQIRRSHPELLPRMLPALAMGIAASTAGQALGYVFGRGSASRRRVPIELRRCEHVRAADRVALESEPSPM